MGTLLSAYVTHPDTMPEAETEPTFDPLYGFKNGRKERGNRYEREFNLTDVPINPNVDYHGDVVHRRFLFSIGRFIRLRYLSRIALSLTL